MDTTPQETTVPETNTPVSAPTNLLPAPGFIEKHKHTIIAVLIALGILGGAGYYAYTKYYGEPVVAVVNGMKVYQKEYDESVNILKENAAAQSIDVASDAAQTEIKKQALDVLINNALLLTASEKAGFTASDEEVQAKYEELAAQFASAEELKTRMAAVGLTEEKLRSNIKERILADKYIESVSDIETLSVTDEEVAAFIEGLGAGAGELPPIEEIKPQIENEIMNQKQQQIVTDLLTKLKAEAEITTSTL